MTQSTQSITLDGYKLTCSTAGDPNRPPLIMVHGWGSYRGVWTQTIDALQSDYYCVAVDLLGFGDSDKPEHADYSIVTQGRRVLQLADALGWRQFTLMGHSMGGQIALCIASMLAPERIRQLVDVDGVASARLSPFAENVTYKMVALARIFPPMFSLYRWLTRQRGLVLSPLSGFRSFFYRMDAIPFENWAIDREICFQPHGQMAMYAAGRAIHGLDLTPSLHNVITPTLIIFGKQDNVALVSDAYLVQKCVAKSHLVLIDECGHFPMYEKQAQYLEAVCAFLT